MYQQKRVLSCLLAFCLLLAWLSPVGYARPGKALADSSININKASIEELTQLPRIGQKVAERIVSYRDNNGPFKKPEDLKAVRGIGDKVFEKIRPMICIK